MKNISTSIKQSSVTVTEIKEEKPARRTIDFLRQFARVYSTTVSATPGIILN